MRLHLRFAHQFSFLYSFGFIVLAAAAFESCKLSGWDTDLEAFVDYGRTVVYLDSSSYVQGSGSAGADVVSGTPVTVTVKLNNPKGLALAYTLDADSSLVSGTLAAPAAPAATTGANDGITTATFTFTPTEAAEHGDVAFKLGLYAPAINRSFAPAAFKVRCDSPPGPVENLTVGIRADGRACIGFTLPEDYADADIASVEISYKNNYNNLSRTVTEAVSRSGSGLTAAPSPVLIDSTKGSYIRYYLPDDVYIGNPYNFTVTTIDASGKRCPTSSSAGVTGDEIFLGYDANGGKGSVAAVYGYNATTTATIAAGTPLSRAGYAFAGWNTKADGTGTPYAPGASYTFGPENLMLYAQWDILANIAITITPTGYQGVAIAQNGTTVTSITMDKDGTLPLTLPDIAGFAADDQKWYVDGVFESGGSSTWGFKPSDHAIVSGTHTVTATERISGVTYSANIVVTVTNEDMVTVVPYSTTATYQVTSVNAGASSLSDAISFYDKISPYRIAKHETTYAVWQSVRDWAEANGYAFENAGTSLMQSLSLYQTYYPGASNATWLSEAPLYPVGNISANDAIVWCNAYSEMKGLDPCYTYAGSVIRDSGNAAACNAAVYDRTKNGYRLPTEGEWQYAAGGCGEIAWNMVSGYDYSAWLPASGANYADYASYNSPAPMPGKPAQKLANRLGLFDMSGNSWEFCFDYFSDSYPAGSSAAAPIDNYAGPGSGSYRATRSGSYGCALNAVIIGYRTTPMIDHSYGFRLARTITQ